MLLKPGMGIPMVLKRTNKIFFSQKNNFPALARVLKSGFVAYLKPLYRQNDDNSRAGETFCLYPGVQRRESCITHK